MSIPVELTALADEITRYGDAAFVLTVGDDERVHVAHERVRAEGAVLRVRAGRTTRANANARPAVTLLWPPIEPEGMSLIVDAESFESGAEDDLHLVPKSAVLHRPALDPSP